MGYDDPLYDVFAKWAKQYGLDAAVEKFGSSPALADDVAGWADQWTADLKRIQNGGPAIIAAGWPAWYSGPGRDDRFWPSLRRYYIDRGDPEPRVQAVDDSSNRVVAHTPRPDRAFDCKGLVVGYVQSGKTTNFTSVIAKLADEDYRFIIVLSGIHNGLRKQTQMRLDEQLRELNPDHWFPLTDAGQDFSARSLGAPAAYLTADNRVVLAVVKKNPAILRRLIKWLDTPNGRQALVATNVVVIDDEADQASVATGSINPLIRKLLGLFPRCTYIGYTATPFANVFVDPTLDDLYPSRFILNLPRPEGYFGPETVFGRETVDEDDLGADGHDMVRYVPEGDLPLLRPVGRGADVGFKPTMTGELIDAVRWFWLATAARRARDEKTAHSTMLIHTSVKTTVHESFKQPLTDLRQQAIDEMTAGTDLEAWRQLWDAETKRVPADDWERVQNTFKEVLEQLPGVLADTRIVLDNSRSIDRLEYTTGEPVVAIAVGGNTLSRGLTLEGLVSSFFVRGASAYDTLLQMGRWFGYRIGYEDLPRIWTTPDLASAFRHLSQVEHEMRQDIDSYQLQDKTPLDIAVRIRTHPVLRVTAKMGAAQPAEISYAGRRLQTRYFRHRDEAWLGTNIAAAERLLANAQQYGEPESATSHLLFRDVPVNDVKGFLSAYEVHPDSPDMDRGMLIKYIDKQLSAETPSLERWNVALVRGTAGDVTLSGLTVPSSVRSRVRDSLADRADIKTLMSKQDLVLDLSISSVEAKAMSEAGLKALRNDDDGVKDKGLLVLYAIDRTSEPGEKRAENREALGAVDTVIGLGIVFPGSADKSKLIPSHVSVDLSLVEREDAEEIDAVLNDAEDEGSA